MRITFISPALNMGGGTRVIGIHAEELQRRGHQVVIVSSSLPPIPIRRKIKSLLRGRGWPKAPVPSASHIDDTDLVSHVLTTPYVTTDDVPDADVVIATWWQTAEWVDTFPPNKGVKVFYIQGHEVFPGQPTDRVEATWHLPFHKLTISDWLVDLAINKYGDPVVTKVPNAVDLEQFRAPPRGKQQHPTVGFLYTTSLVKGIDVCLETIALLQQRISDLEVVCFGAHEPIDEYPLPSGAVFTHRPAQDAIRDLYASCDVWLCGSRSEGFHLVPTEAMACRCPVVSTKVGGPIDSIEEGVNGYLVDQEDVQALARRVEHVLSLSQAEWKTMSDAAWSTASSYTWQQAGDLFEKALERFIEQGPRSDR